MEREQHRVPSIVALIPAYNEEESISEVIRQAHNFTSQVIVCDDGSVDSTYGVSVASGANVIRHHTNFGYGAALRSLFLKAAGIRADAFVTIDSDGQHDSKFIPALAESVVRGEADIVIGSRFLSRDLDSTPPHRKLAIKLITSVFNLIGHYRLTDLQSGFRAYSRKALSVTCPSRTGMGASTEIIKRAMSSGLRVREVPAPIYYRGKQPSLISTGLQFLDVFQSTLTINPTYPQSFDQSR